MNRLCRVQSEHLHNDGVGEVHYLQTSASFLLSHCLLFRSLCGAISQDWLAEFVRHAVNEGIVFIKSRGKFSTAEEASLTGNLVYCAAKLMTEQHKAVRSKKCILFIFLYDVTFAEAEMW